ncbi:MAG: ABC transporter ATP-binding protein [Bacilli bacterium]
MRENISMFKSWHTLAKPSRKYFLICFFMVLLASICLIIEPVFEANVITNLTNEKYTWAIGFALLSFSFIFIRKMSWDINYRFHYKLLNHTYINLQEQIFKKVIKATSVNFDNNSKEKLINIIHNDVYTVSEFSYLIATRLARLFRVLLTVGIIFTINIPVALVIVCVDLLNYKILNYLQNKRAYANRLTVEDHDAQYRCFSELVDSKELVCDLNIEREIKNRFLSSTKKYIKDRKQYDICGSYIDNYFHIFYQFIKTCIVLFLIFLVSKGSLTLTTYLIVVPYILSGIEIANDFMNILPELKNANISTNRVKIIFDFTDKKILDFGNNKLDNILGILNFENVSYKQNTEVNGLTTINNISFTINANESVLFLGGRGSGKRTIFYLLRREIMQNSGDIYVDNINLMDYTKKVYSSNINYIVTKPYFFDDTIMKNLKLVEKDKHRIFSICRQLKIHDYIKSLPKGYNTNVNKLPSGKRYIIGLARTLLTKSEIIILYEFPLSLSAKEKETIMKILNHLRGSRTIIIFSASDACMSVVDRVFKIEKGSIASTRKISKKMRVFA